MIFMSENQTPAFKWKLTIGALATCAALLIPHAHAASDAKSIAVTQPPVATYADLADLADSASTVVRAQVRRIARLDAERAGPVRQGFARFYVEARTRGLLAGTVPLGEKLHYLADFPLDAKGRPPKLVKAEVVLFAHAVPGKASELQLIAPDAQIPATPQVESQLRTILAELAAPDSPPSVFGVREAIHVPGMLAGEGETQMFLSTRNDTAAAIVVTHRPGEQPGWTWSFSELAGNGNPPPTHETLAWYRLACFLPTELPPSADLSERPQDRAQARSDYRLVRRELGVCPRLRR